jgi:predicted DNA-binding protein with PD1-like motif
MQVVSDGARFILRLDDGQDLFGAISDFARRHGVRAAAVVNGIGMIKVGSIGFWNGKEYAPHEIRTPHELVSLQGSIAEIDGNPSIHLHVALAGPDHSMLGGHLLRATVGILSEVVVDAFPGRVFGRPMNESLGLRTLDLEPGPAP